MTTSTGTDTGTAGDAVLNTGAAPGGQSSDERFSLVVVHAGVSEPSSTRLLADRAARRIGVLSEQAGAPVTVRTVDLRAILPELPAALGSQLLGPRLTDAVEALADADGLVASTPVYKAGASGLFTSFFQVLDNDLLIGTPVLLAATAGTARHALVVDQEIRSLFAYLRTLVVPTSLFATPEDWSDPALDRRIDRAARELVLLMRSGFARDIRDSSWGHYQHTFGSAGGAETSIDLDSDLMRLATGGSLPPAST